MRLRTIALVPLGAALLAAAAVRLSADEPPAMPAGDPGEGARQWADNCARCHNLRDPKEFRDDVWRPILLHMRVRAGLTGQQARDILAFLQASNFAPAGVAPASRPEAGVSPDPERGAALYAKSCIACHGPDGRGGLPGVPDLRERLAKPDATLLRSMKAGIQSPGSRMAMPPLGGNPRLSDADLADLLGYLRQQFSR